MLGDACDGCEGVVLGLELGFKPAAAVGKQGEGKRVQRLLSVGEPCAIEHRHGPYAVVLQVFEVEAQQVFLPLAAVFRRQ